MKVERCPGGLPVRIVKEAISYELKDPPGKPHILPGRAICPTCGREVGYRTTTKNVASHKKAET